MVCRRIAMKIDQDNKPREKIRKIENKLKLSRMKTPLSFFSSFDGHEMAIFKFSNANVIGINSLPRVRRVLMSSERSAYAWYLLSARHLKDGNESD